MAISKKQKETLIFVALELSKRFLELLDQNFKRRDENATEKDEERQP